MAVDVLADRARERQHKTDRGAFAIRRAFEAEIPGAKRDDVDVEVRDSEIAITGKIKDREREGLLRRKARRVGRFEFRVTLPGKTDPENLEADHSDGVLTVRVPKGARAVRAR